MRQATMKSYLVAGMASGIAGLLVFLVIHHIWIRPIWFILPLGSGAALAGGLAVGWAYHELQPGLPSHPWTSLVLAALVGLILLPSLVLAEIREPMFDVTIPGGRLRIGVGQAALTFIMELLVTSALSGGLVGFLIGHTWRAALVTALAGFIFALGPGHNIPFLGGTPGNVKGALLLSAIVITSAFVLVEAQAWFSK
jgi:hypothetical protein